MSAEYRLQPQLAILYSIISRRGQPMPLAFRGRVNSLLKSLGRSGRPSFSGSLQGRDVGQSGFECELVLFGTESDAFSTYERGVADADEPEETRQECFLMVHEGHRRRGGVESTTGRGGDQLLTARETLHAGRGVFGRLAGRGKAINPGL